MANTVTLTSSMRSNLGSLKTIQTQMNKTQERLSSGKKVNSAIDNASSFYQARSLTNRASDLNALLDAMGQGIQTIQAAIEGIEAATNFLDQMKSVVTQAASVAGYEIMELIEINSSMTSEQIQNCLNINGARIYLSDDISLNSPFIINGKDVHIDGNGHQLTASFMEARNDGFSLENLDFNGLLSISGNNASINNVNLSQESTSLAANGIIVVGDQCSISNTNVSVDRADSDYVVGVMLEGSGNTLENVSITLNAGGIAIGFGQQGGSSTLSGVTVEVEDAYMSVGTYYDANSTINGTTFDDEGFLLLDDFNAAYGAKKETTTIDISSYESQFNTIKGEYDNLIADSSYQGINLLNGGTLTVTFDENRLHNYLVQGSNITSSNLGIDTADWSSAIKMNMSLAAIDDAIETLRSYAETLGNSYSIIETRQNFTDALINVLETGADNLVLADMNEEAANYLALQTRQQLAINSLSLASQSAQSVLKLF